MFFKSRVLRKAFKNRSLYAQKCAVTFTDVMWSFMNFSRTLLHGLSVAGLGLLLGYSCTHSTLLQTSAVGLRALRQRQQGERCDQVLSIPMLGLCCQLAPGHSSHRQGGCSQTQAAWARVWAHGLCSLGWVSVLSLSVGFIGERFVFRKQTQQFTIQWSQTVGGDCAAWKTNAPMPVNPPLAPEVPSNLNYLLIQWDIQIIH